jgi:hypothetical protein
MYSDPGLWHALAGRLAAIAGQFLRMQVEAGASAVQVFDSWAGALSAADYREFVAPHSKAVFDAVADLGVPRMHFGVGTGELLHDMGTVGADVVGVDWRIPLDEAARRVGPDKSLQGNLDPTLLFAPTEVVHHRAAAIIEAGKAARGLAALEASPLTLDATPHVGQIALACALGYLDLRFKGKWRSTYPKLVAWLDRFAAQVPAFAATARCVQRGDLKNPAAPRLLYSRRVRRQETANDMSESRVDTCSSRNNRIRCG